MTVRLCKPGRRAWRWYAGPSYHHNGGIMSDPTARPTCPACGRTDNIWGIQRLRGYDGVSYWWCPTFGCGAFPRADAPGSDFFAREWRWRCERLGTDPTVVPQFEPDMRLPPNAEDRR